MYHLNFKLIWFISRWCPESVSLKDFATFTEDNFFVNTAATMYVFLQDVFITHVFLSYLGIKVTKQNTDIAIL